MLHIPATTIPPQSPSMGYSLLLVNKMGAFLVPFALIFPFLVTKINIGAPKFYFYSNSYRC